MDERGPGPLRVLHAPRNIANQAGDVVAALRRRGHHAEVWESRPDSPAGADRRLDLAGGGAAATMAAIADAVAGFDVIHFHFGQTFVPWNGDLPPYWDLPVLRALGKRVYFTFHGSEVRLARVFRERNPWADRFQSVSEPDDERTEKAIQVMRTYANRMFVVSVNYLEYVPDAEYLPRVIDLAAWPERAPRDRDRPVVVHAASSRGTKGSDTILAVLEQLGADGEAFDLRVLEGVPHDEVRTTLADADILVDNVIAGSYGIASLEAMASGMVAVSNMSEALRRRHPDAPVVHVDPDTLHDTLRRLIRDRGERAALAARGRPYVAAVHDADRIAAALEAFYRAPVTPIRGTTMPDWASMARVRRIETLHARLDRLESELGRARLREAELRAAVNRPEAGGPSVTRRIVRRVLPAGLRRRLGG